MARGLANKEIGDVLKISTHTVTDDLKNILGKLRVAIPLKPSPSLSNAASFSCRVRP